MKVLIVHVHPEATSFCAALKDAAISTISACGHEAIVSDLYGENFNPVAGRHDFTTVHDADRFHYQSEQLHAARSGAFAPDIAREQSRIEQADAILFIFPLWWGGPPAMLKGWIDRVLAYGFAYLDGARFDSGLFRNKRSMICVTTGGTEERFSDEGVYGPIEKVLWPVQRLTLDYMGLEAETPFVCYGAPRVSSERRADYLAQWAERLKAMLEKGRSKGARADVSLEDTGAAWTRNA